MKRVINQEVVAQEFAAGRRKIAAPAATTVITPGAWSKAQELGVVFEGRGGQRPTAAPPKTPKPRRTTPVEPRAGSADRAVDRSGLVVVRGSSVRLGTFTGAGPDRNIGLLDLVTGADGSPMTAGIMAWGREDSFPWSLDYDEIDLVLEGVLHIQMDGRTVEARVGDVVYIPKGSHIVFGTPHRTRVFYVTHPANWAGSGGQTRPLK